MTRWEETRDEDRSLPAERRKILLVAAPLIGGICLASAPAIQELPHHGPWELICFTLTGVALITISLLLFLRRMSYPVAAFATMALTAGLLLVRLLTLFASGTFDDPSRSFFMAVYAHYATLYVLFVLLLPYPYSARCGVVAWLVMAVLTTVGTQPYWHENPPRQLLSALLVYIWLGHGLLVTLLFGWARQQHRLIQLQSHLATAERRAREASEASDIRFKGIFEQVAAGIGLFGIDGRWLEVNARLGAILGYSPDELIGCLMTEVTPEEDHTPFRQRMATMLSGPAPDYSVERRAIRSDGRVIWLQAQMRRLVTAPGQPAEGILLAVDITERKLAEQQAAESRRIREFHFEHTSLCVIEWTADVRVKRWSRQAEALFGWSESEVIGRGPFDWKFIHESEQAAARQHVLAITDGVGGPIQITLRIYRKDGSHGWFEWHNSALHDGEGKLVSLHSLVNDVSELRFALQAREDSEEQLDAVFEQAAVGMSLLNADGSWRKVNQQLCEITGYTRAELLATDFQTLTHADDLAIDAERAQQLITGQIDRYDLEKRYIHRLGHIIWVKIFASRLDATATQPPLYVAVIEDISERIQAQREAIEQERVQQVHFENTPLGIIEWSPDLVVKRWSRRAESMFGWSESEALGRSAFDLNLVHGDDLGMIEAGLATILAGEQPLVAIINRNLRKDGSVVWCHWYNSVLRDADGGIRSIYALVNDVSEEQFAIAALSESQARFRSIFEQAAVGIGMIDADNRWLMVNRRFCEIVGYSAEELLMLTCPGITHPDDRISESPMRKKLISGLIDNYTIEKRYVRQDGSEVWASLFARRLDDQPGVSGHLALVIEDITERRAAEVKIHQLNVDLERKVIERTRQLQDSVRQSAERNQELSLLAGMMGVLPAARDAREANQIVGRFLPRLFQRYSGSVWIEDRVVDRFGLIEQWGPAANASTTAPVTIVADDCWALRRNQVLRVEDPHDPLCCPHLQQSGKLQEPHCCIPIMALGDTVGLVYLSWSERSAAQVSPPDKALLASVTEQIGLAIGNVRLREELRRQATRDPLTGLFNRRHFDDSLARRVAEHARSGRCFVLMMIDIDHFKRINDTYGHDAGDEVLRGVGGLLQKIVRADEAVFRLGGEEFVMLVNDEPGTDIAGCAERLRLSVQKQRFSWSGQNLPTVTISIGVARFPIDGVDAIALVQRADQALYAAKRTGRNRTCYASALPESVPAIRAVIDADGTVIPKSTLHRRRLTDR